MTRKIITVVIAVSSLIFIYATKSKAYSKKADLVLKNGKIITVDEHFSIKEAVAIKNNKIIFVGSNNDVESYIGKKTRVIKLDGKVVLPGLIDAHAHMRGFGRELSTFNVNNIKSFDGIVKKAKEFVKSKSAGEWIIGGRWNQTKWKNKDFPIHNKLSQVTPDNPVYLSRVDGNSALVNQRALDIAGITKNTLDPEGGKILRKKNGEPTGVLINRALNLVKKHFPKDRKDLWQRDILRGVEDCLEKGLTGWHEAGASETEINWYKELVDHNKLKMRAYVMFGEQKNPILKGNLYEILKRNKLDNYKDFLSVRSIKLFFDGALGSRGAAFFEEYSDDPGNRGLFRINPNYIYQISKAALKVGMGVNTHCIGIRGIKTCLDSYIKAIKESPEQDHRFRIEHAQIVKSEDINLFKKYNIIPSMQPTHCTSDKNFVETRIGKERCKGAYAWRWFIDAGLPVPTGSDFPVESNNPFFGIYASITRMDKEGYPKGGWYPDQKMDRVEAIKGFTIWAAYAAFQEKNLGSIEIGKFADFTIIDRDILTIPPLEILKIKTIYTIVNGDVKYQAN